ncbi:MAG: hypothetical protein Kow00105_16410 [Phycisphaeraceae bacterium]
MSEAVAAGPIATGVLVEKSPDKLVLAVPGTDYRLRLVPVGPIQAEVNERVSGIIRAKALRVDVIPAGGRFIEPVFGRPRRVQGRIIGGDVKANTLTVQACVPITVTLMPNQRAAQFAIGQMVSFDVEPGATFEQTA